MKKKTMPRLALKKQTLSHLAQTAVKGGIVPSDLTDCDTMQSMRTCRITCPSRTCPVQPVYDQQ